MLLTCFFVLDHYLPQEVLLVGIKSSQIFADHTLCLILFVFPQIYLIQKVDSQLLLAKITVFIQYKQRLVVLNNERKDAPDILRGIIHLVDCDLNQFEVESKLRQNRLNLL